jgi:hypothetical protein
MHLLDCGFTEACEALTGRPPPGRGNGNGAALNAARDPTRTGQALGRIVATYDYRDEAGALAFQAVRYEPKTFRQRRPDGNGGWTWNMQGAPRVIYRLPEVKDAIAGGDPVYVVEGEKDVDALWRIGIPATCNVAGAGKWRDEDSAFLAGADVVVCPDHDEPGRRHADLVARSLAGIAARVRVLHLPNLPDKGDVSDWLDAGGTADALWTLADAAPEWHGESADDDIDLAVICGDDDEPIRPRQWLMGTSFCKGFVGAVVAAGATGKTALRVAQLLSLAIGRQLTGEHVFRRSRVLFVTLEDNNDEMRRRVRAARIHHKISRADIDGWFFRVTLTRDAGKLVVRDEKGNIVPGPLARAISRVVTKFNIDLVCFDPFVKAHSEDENSNKAIDEVVRVFVDLADALGIAIDTTHHTSKGTHVAGNADQGRGASSMKDALRIGKTLMPMTPEEAKALGVPESERRQYVRYDDAKPNLAPFGDTKWFRLVGVPIGNADEIYPNGDHVQTVEPWNPPDAWSGMNSQIINEILNTIDNGMPDGNRYSKDPKAERAAWRIVAAMAKKPEHEAKTIVKAWVTSGLLYPDEYDNPVTRKKVQGLFVNATLRPS